MVHRCRCVHKTGRDPARKSKGRVCGEQHLLIRRLELFGVLQRVLHILVTPLWGSGAVGENRRVRIGVEICQLSVDLQIVCVFTSVLSRKRAGREITARFNHITT